MSRRDNRTHRCPRCVMHKTLCVCALVPRLETRTRLVLLIHRAEARKPTNTGRLALACLVNSEVHVRGREGEPSGRLAWEETDPMLLFPHEDAIELGAGAGGVQRRPVTLVVPDGNWRQASRMRARVPGLQDIPCVMLPKGPPSTYRLRFEAHDGGLATVEAIARALVRRALERIFDAMVERTLWARGALEACDVTGGVPPGAMRHDPGGRQNTA
jgi:DTW domain-containing protein